MCDCHVRFLCGFVNLFVRLCFGVFDVCVCLLVCLCAFLLACALDVVIACLFV